MLLTLMHYPCGTTLLTIRKETQSWRWTLASFLVPTITGLAACFLWACFARLLGFYDVPCFLLDILGRGKAKNRFMAKASGVGGILRELKLSLWVCER